MYLVTLKIDIPGIGKKGQHLCAEANGSWWFGSGLNRACTYDTEAEADDARQTFVGDDGEIYKLPTSFP